MARDISSINMLSDLNNHLENGKHLLKSCVCSRTGWSSLKYDSKMRMPLFPGKTNLDLYTSHEMVIALNAFQFELIPILSGRVTEWAECINDITLVDE